MHTATDPSRPLAVTPLEPSRPSPGAGSGRGETLRKLLHIVPGILPFVLALTPHPDPLNATAIVGVAAIVTAMTLLYLSLKRYVRRPGETDFAAAPVSYAVAVLGTLIAFPAAPELACIVTIVIALGDGGACLVGRWLGGPRLPWNRGKTWAGTIAFVLVAFPVAALAYWIEARPAVPFALATLCAGAASVVAAIAESVESRITDNLRVGVSAALVAAAVHYAAGPWFHAS